jgi:hypothetical protein
MASRSKRGIAIQHVELCEHAIDIFVMVKGDTPLMSVIYTSSQNSSTSFLVSDVKGGLN